MGDPVFDGLDFSRSELLFGWHVWVGIDLDHLREGAFFCIAGDQGSLCFSPFDGRFHGAEV